MEQSQVTLLRRKSYLDQRVAELLGKSPKEVATITAAFLDETVRALVQEERVHLPQLGTLHVNVREGVVPFAPSMSYVFGVKYYVGFRKSLKLRRALREALVARRREKDHGQVRR